MKDSQKNRKMPKKKRVIIEIMKVFKTSLKISIGVNVLLLVLNIRNEYFKNATKLVISMLPHKAQVLINKVVRR